MEESEEFDEFLFESITRYHTLQMFDLDNVPYHLLQLDETSICVASRRDKGMNTELLRLQLPKKLSLSHEEESLSKDNDFKIISGTYTESLVHNIDKLTKNKVVISEENTCGLKIYSFTDKPVSETSKKPENLLVVPWESSDLVSINDTNNLICSKSTEDPIYMVDVEEKKKIMEINHPFINFNCLEDKYISSKGNNIKCQCLSQDVIIILNCNSGDLVLYDLRTKNCFSKMKNSAKHEDNEIWTLSKNDAKKSFPNFFGILSSRSSFYIYDKRDNSVLFENKGTEALQKSSCHLKFKFCEKEDKFSTSGLGSVVNVFKIKNYSFKHVFSHNGHSPSNQNSNIVTDHLWLSTGYQDLIVSICDNKTLNCWNHNEKHEMIF